MTNEIEMTKREMFRLQKEMLNDPYTDGVRNQCYRLQDKAYGKFESALESHLEALRQDRGRLVEERDALRNRVQVLESANKIAGERLRVVTEAQEQLSAISHHGMQQNASCATLDAKTEAILSAVVDVQRIVTDWATKGLKAKEAMRLVAGVVNGGPCYQAMLAFEKPEKPEISINSIRSMFAKNKPRAEAAIDQALQDLVIHGVGAYWVTADEAGMQIGKQQAAQMFKNSGCQHEFHPKFPSGEMCTYCGVSK